MITFRFQLTPNCIGATNYRFHEGFLTGVFTNKETFDLYLCPKCGKVEFFAPQEDQPFKLL